MSNSLKISGALKRISDSVHVSDKFKKREFVLTDSSTQYPQHIQFQLSQDRCALIDNFKEGDQVEVYFNLRGREWTSPQDEIKYFNTLDAWKIVSGAGASETPETPPHNNSDLPF